MIKPNFFIVGAPKCGTTALCEYLRSHPHIFVSQPKETHYFAEDFPEYRPVKTLEQYLNLFENITEKHLAVGEASVFYLYSSVAIPNLYKFNPNSKIIAIVRNPVDLVYSYHSQLVYSGYENEREFERAWSLQVSRQKGLNIPEECQQPELLQYAEVGKVGSQIERLLQVMPQKQVKVILFDDFIASPQAVYEDILSFLQVMPDGRNEFPRVNENKSYKIYWVGKLTQNPPKPLLNMAMEFKKMMGLKELNVLNKIRNLNTKINSRPPINPILHAQLLSEFRTDIKKLSNILEKDLSHWLN